MGYDTNVKRPSASLPRTENLNKLKQTTPMNITLTTEEMLDAEELFACVSEGWSKKQILGMMGYLNNLVGCIAMKYQAIQKVTIKIDGNRKTIQQLVYGRFVNLLEVSEMGEARVSVPISYTSRYLKEHWQGSYHSPTWVRKNRIVLSQLGIFEFTQQLPGQGDNQPSASYKRFDVVQALLFYSYLENLYKEKGHDLADMPLHKGLTMSLLLKPVLDHVVRSIVPRTIPKPIKKEWEPYQFYDLTAWNHQAQQSRTHSYHSAGSEHPT
jgi:hypothetical protein